jgi:hypothetical protein
MTAGGSEKGDDGVRLILDHLNLAGIRLPIYRLL